MKCTGIIIFRCAEINVSTYSTKSMFLLCRRQITGDAEVIGQNKNVNNLFINKKTNCIYIFFK